MWVYQPFANPSQFIKAALTDQGPAPPGLVLKGNDSRLHSARIYSQGPLDMCVYKKDCITQVIIILLQRRA